MSNLERYIPSQIIGDTPEEIVQSLSEELIRVSDALASLTDKIELTNIAPDKYENGELRLADGTNWNPGDGEGLYLRSSGVWKKLLTSLVSVANGGTGVATLGDAGVLVGNGTGAVQVTGAGTAGQLLTSNGVGVDPTFQTAAAVLDATETVKGIIELATNAEALAGTDTARAVTSAGLASSKSIATSGYFKLPGGLIIQWGTGTSGAGGSANVTLPIAFPNNHFAFVCESMTAAYATNSTWGHNVSLTAGTLYSTGGATTMGYIAIGN